MDASNHFKFNSQRILVRYASFSPPKKVAFGLGLFLMFLGLVGFAAPHLLGERLGTAYNLIHFSIGALAVYYGANRNSSEAKVLCWTLGALFGLVGIMGFVLGYPGIPANTGMIELSSDAFYFPLVSGTLEIGTADHLMNLLVSSLFLVGAAAHHSPQHSSGHSLKR